MPLVNKLPIILLVGLLLLATAGPALAQEDECTEEDCEECTDCRTNNFYYILVTAIIVFLVFFFLRNRAPVMKK